MLESQWKTEKKMSVAEVVHVKYVPAHPFCPLVAIIFDPEAALAQEYLT